MPQVTQYARMPRWEYWKYDVPLGTIGAPNPPELPPPTGEEPPVEEPPATGQQPGRLRPPPPVETSPLTGETFTVRAPRNVPPPRRPPPVRGGF
jgi:hypothetical protein